jgi:hypothetical protein
MVIAKTFEELRAALDELARLVSRLRVEIEDEPRRPALADPFKYGAEDIEGWVEEASADLASVSDAAAGSPDLDRARLALGNCNRRVLDATRRINDLLGYERIEELVRFDTERGARWGRDLGAALERCREQLGHVHSALLDAWDEAADRAAAGSVSVRSTNIGQQVSVPTEVAEGVT